jgi:hypothetical protein
MTPKGVASLEIIDPHYKSRILVVHGDLSRREVAELITIYHALGYPATCLLLTVGASQEAD